MIREGSAAENFSHRSRNDLINEILSLRKELENSKHNEELYRQQILAMKKGIYGSKSEKSDTFAQPSLFNEVEDSYQEDTSEEELAEYVSSRPRKKKKSGKKKSNINLEDLVTETIHVDRKDKNCPVCGSMMKELAPTVKYVMSYVPGHFVVKKIIIHNYVCAECTEKNGRMKTVVSEGVPSRLIEGSVIDGSVVAGIATNKFVMGTPLYRQEKELKMRGIPISRQNMSNWLMKAGEMYLQPLYDRMKEDLGKLDIIHMDETTLTCLEEKKNGQESKSYVWGAISNKWMNKQMGMYFYHANREHEFVKEILPKDYSGTIQSDGYDAYHKLNETCTSVGCMAHMRRKFIEALEVEPAHKDMKKATLEQQKEILERHPKYRKILTVVHKIGKLYSIEHSLKDSDVETIYKVRQEQAKPVLEDLFTCIESYRDEFSYQGKMGKAITYVLNQKEYIMNYIRDGRYAIDNNRAERDLIKVFVIDRKNFLFSNTVHGAEITMIYLSLIQSAILNGLDPNLYLQYVFEKGSTNHMTDKLINELLPYSKSLPDSIKSKGKPKK